MLQLAVFKEDSVSLGLGADPTWRLGSTSPRAPGNSWREVLFPREEEETIVQGGKKEEKKKER